MVYYSWLRTGTSFGEIVRGTESPGSPLLSSSSVPYPFQLIRTFLNHDACRDSRQTTVLASELLPGDIVSFTVGDRIPADVRLLTTLDLYIDESSLTGEAHAVRKSTDPCAKGVPLGERSSVAFMGSLVRNGVKYSLDCLPPTPFSYEGC
jgi:magnesium-transporting ATPase (P-type)